MPEDVIESLSRFTPVAPDSAAMLFAAGRASARSTCWKWLVGILAITQAVTLGLWWTSARSVPVVESQPLETKTPNEPSVAEPFGDFSYAALQRGDVPKPNFNPSEIAETPALTPRSAYQPNRN